MNTLAPPVRPRSGVATDTQTRVLCVDDEPNILEGLGLHLRRRYAVTFAANGAAGLEALKRDRSIAVVISDMRMPGMNGAVFLNRARVLVPDATRMLLTGQADVESAIAAVNEGQVFRFLTKPCPPATLLMAVAAAADQYRLVTSERVLLEQTLQGSIKALTDVLALTSPLSFGRAIRIKRLVSDLAEHLQMSERWQVEVAAMLSQLGCITLPAETMEKVYHGRLLTVDEQRMVRHLPVVTVQLLASIPRLEAVCAIVTACAMTTPFPPVDPGDASQALILRGAQVLRVAIDFVALDVQSHYAGALNTMKGRPGRYDPVVLDALDAVRGVVTREPDTSREVGLSELEVGMVLVEDIELISGALLAASGYEVTSGFVARAENFLNSIGKKTVRVTGPVLKS